VEQKKGPSSCFYESLSQWPGDAQKLETLSLAGIQSVQYSDDRRYAVT